VTDRSPSSVQPQPPPAAQPHCFVGTGIASRLGGPGTSPQPALPDPSPFVMDAGEELTLVGPAGRVARLVKSHSWPWVGDYRPDSEDSVLPAGFLIGGNWTLTSGGGDDLAAFSVTFALAPPFRVHSPDLVDRNVDLDLTWSTGPLTGEDVADIMLSSSPRLAEGVTSWEFTSANCWVPASLGAFSIPSATLLELPPSERGRIHAWLFEATQRYFHLIEIPGIDRATVSQSPSYSKGVIIQ